ncbi:ribonuclease HI [Shuttleworthella satelles]|uniref:Ribonuclease H n=1 Tax=Shuttleworthella satelles DSM 14600 TaxID=626523 RepID=C4G985_9FIRM|nr:ribonuclease HI [Shuttleworthia satelles]EEP29182.1 ribonuclease HI [Shuttleworthia satelles DSM 14600]
MRVTIYTDGAARGNPDGPGGYGAVISYVDARGQEHIKELSCGYKKTTNNRMELMGVIRALEALKCPCQVDLWSDSQYVVKAFEEHWIDKWQKNGWKTAGKKAVKNIDLWKKLLELMSPHQVTFHWVKGHAGQTYNERCDFLATSAADGENLCDDVELN